MKPPRRPVQNLHRQQLASNPQTEPTFLTAKEGAAFLRLSEITLARWRGEGAGPPYRKFGRRVVYSKLDLIRWADDQRHGGCSAEPVLEPIA